MADIRWLTSMSVGVEQWDADHRVLLDLIGRLDDLLRSGRSDPSPLMDTLSRYVDVHLGSEERTMERLGYPHFEAHRAKHDEFRTWFKEVTAAAPAARPAAAEIADMLVHWWYVHIVTVDMAYKDFFENRRRETVEVLRDYEGPGRTAD